MATRDYRIMLRTSGFIFLLTCWLFPSMAQSHKNEKSHAVIVVGKVLSAADSNLVRQLFFDGLHAKMIRNQQLASDYFKRVIDLDPANDASMYELAAMYHADNKEAEAEVQIRKAVTVSPQNRWYWLLLADIYKQSNNVSKLIPVFDELMRLEPANPDHYFDKANALVILKKIGEANLLYNDIEKRYGSSAELSEARQRVFIRQGKPEKAAEELEKQISLNPDDIKSLLNLADIYNRSGDHEKSLTVLNKASLIDPGNVMLRLSLADTYRSLKRYDDAFMELKEAFEDSSFSIDEKIRITLSFFPQFQDEKARSQAHELAEILTRVHPADAKSFSIFGDVLFQEKRFGEAALSYRQALKLNDQVYQIWEQLVRIELNNGKFQQVIEDGETALSIFPNQGVLYLLTSMAYAQIKKHEKAVSYLNMAASLEAEDKEIVTQIYSALGDSYNALKRYPESDESFTKALEINPDNTYTLNNYAYYLSLRGESLAKAEEMSARSNKLDPNNPSFEDTYAWILFKLKRYSEARIWIEKAMSHSNRESAVQVEHFGDILFQLNEKEKALSLWQKAKSLGSTSDKLQQKLNAKKYIE